MIRHLLLLSATLAFTLCAFAERVPSPRSDHEIRSIPYGDGSCVVVLLDADGPKLSIRVRGGRLEDLRVISGLAGEVSWRQSDDEARPSLLEISRIVGGDLKVVDVVCISATDVISFADDEVFQRSASSLGSAHAAIGRLIDQFAVDVTDEEEGGEPGATDNPDDAQRLREDH